MRQPLSKLSTYPLIVYTKSFRFVYTLECILQTNLATPAAVVIAIALVSVSTGKLVKTTTQGDTHVVLSLLLILRRITRSIQIRILDTDEVLVVAIVIGRTVELVGTALGDGIDGTTGETALSHIERSYRYLNLLDGLHRYRLSTRLTAVMPLEARPNTLLLAAPSIMKLLYLR